MEAYKFVLFRSYLYKKNTELAITSYFLILYVYSYIFLCIASFILFIIKGTNVKLSTLYHWSSIHSVHGSQEPWFLTNKLSFILLYFSHQHTAVLCRTKFPMTS